MREEWITSRKNPLLVQIRRLVSSRGARRSAGMFLGDGVKLLEGVKLIQRQFEETLKKLGVEEIKAVGEPFNPNLHNAVMHVDDENVGDNIVVEEFQKGYMYKDTVVRHSMVKVAN